MKLITWNIQCGKGCDGIVDLRRIVETARALGQADVLCLQEIAVNFPAADNGEGADQPAILAGLLPDHAPIFRPAIDFAAADGRRRQFGNMVLSRLPVLQALSHLLPRPAEAGRRSMQRQALEAVIETSFGPLRVLTTHLEFYSVAHRAAQIERLRELHAEAALRALHPDKPDLSQGTYRTVARPASALVCGDFNCETSEPAYGRMLAGFADGVPAFRDAWPLAHSAVPHAPTCGIHDAAQWPQGAHCRDFVFVTEDLAPRVREVAVDVETPASDHQPVLIELE